MEGEEGKKTWRTRKIKQPSDGRRRIKEDTSSKIEKKTSQVNEGKTENRQQQEEEKTTNLMKGQEEDIEKEKYNPCNERKRR